MGKTTTTVNVAAYLALGGKRVLLVDADSQANATSSLGIDKNRPEPSIYEVLLGDAAVEEAITPIDHPIFGGRLDLLPSSKQLSGAEVELAAEAQGEREQLLRDILHPLKSRYDYILIDCPPSLGLITLNALTSADAVIIPLQCEYLALEGLVQLRETISLVLQGLNRNLRILGIAMTMYDSRTNLSAMVVQEVKKYYPREVFNTPIPRSIRLSEAPSYSQSILEYDPNSRGAIAYAELAAEIAARSGDTLAFTPSQLAPERSVAQ